MITVLASQELYPERLTETSIFVSYTPEAGVAGSQMVARNSKLGRFFGTCDARTCTVSGLSSGFIYEIWVRTCSGSGTSHCILRAMSAQMVTYPRGKISLHAHRVSAVMKNSICIFLIIAPTTIKVTPKTTTSVTVAMTAVEGNTDVSFYEAGFQREYCTVPAGSSPLSCTIGDLKAGTSYRVYAMACMPDYECSYRKFVEGYTQPDGELPTRYGE